MNNPKINDLSLLEIGRAFNAGTHHDMHLERFQDASPSELAHLSGRVAERRRQLGPLLDPRFQRLLRVVPGMLLAAFFFQVHASASTPIWSASLMEWMSAIESLHLMSYAAGSAAGFCVIAFLFGVDHLIDKLVDRASASVIPIERMLRPAPLTKHASYVKEILEKAHEYPQCAHYRERVQAQGRDFLVLDTHVMNFLKNRPEPDAFIESQADLVRLFRPEISKIDNHHVKHFPQ